MRKIVLKKINKTSGFTLVELLGVIIIISAIIALVFPNIVDFIKDKNNDIYSFNERLVFSAADDFLQKNKDDFEKKDGNSYCISIRDLVDEGYLKGPIILSDESEDDTDLKSVQADYNDGYSYTIKDNKDCDEYIYVDSYKAPELNGADPKLYRKMVPIVYDEDNEEWDIADRQNKWYDYTKQEWANAAILEDGVSDEVGKSLDLETEVKAMFVWIPRFSYTIGNTYGFRAASATVPNIAQPGGIDIKFVSSNVKEFGTATYTGNTPSGWRTHPSFTFGGKELSGFWIGKFDTTGSLPEPTILPGNEIMFGIISELFNSSKTFGDYIGNADSHVAKNSDWGAMAYLSQSKYGKYGNSMYTYKNKEIYINMDSDFISGASNGATQEQKNDPQCPYDDIADRGSGTGSCGGGASTTGNIYGVYDVSGAGWDAVMGVLSGTDGLPRSGETENNNSGFSGMLADGSMYVGEDMPDPKYYDLYIAPTDPSKNFLEACGGICYGHAMSETLSPTNQNVGWYQDYYTFLTPKSPWLRRGGYQDGLAQTGIFQFSIIEGGEDTLTTHIVITDIAD